MAGNASTTMFVFSGLYCGAPPPGPPDEHPAASIVTTTADATSTLRDFILAPSDVAASPAARGRLGGPAPGSADRPRHEHHNVPHRPSHAKRCLLFESSDTLSSAAPDSPRRWPADLRRSAATFDGLVRGRGSKTKRTPGYAGERIQPMGQAMGQTMGMS